MTRIFIVLLFGALCAVAGAQEIEPSVSGRVVRAGDGMPIEGASVRLERAEVASSNGEYPTAITDAHGEYRFGRDIEAGTDVIRASAAGFVSRTFSSDGSLEGKFQRVDGSKPLRGIDFRLEREAVIRGELVDAEGKAAGGEIAVAAVRKEKQEDGSERLLPVSWVKTDAKGSLS
jgi:hypothetical protein